MKWGKYLILFCAILLTGCNEAVVFERVASEPEMTSISDNTLDTTDILLSDIEINYYPDMAEKRMNDLIKRLEVRDISLDIIQLGVSAETVEPVEWVTKYYSLCTYLRCNDAVKDIGCIVNTKGCYLLDNKTKIAYKISNDVAVLDLNTLLGTNNIKQWEYVGSGVQSLNDADLFCDIYVEDEIVHKLCYDANNNLISLGYKTLDGELWYIFKVLTTVQDTECFEVPEDYTILDYDDYLNCTNGGKNKFDLLLSYIDND